MEALPGEDDIAATAAEAEAIDSDLTTKAPKTEIVLWQAVGPEAKLRAQPDLESALVGRNVHAGTLVEQIGDLEEVIVNAKKGTVVQRLRICIEELEGWVTVDARVRINGQATRDFSFSALVSAPSASLDLPARQIRAQGWR